VFRLPVLHTAVPGTLYNANTMEDFNKFDKIALMNQAGKQVRETTWWSLRAAFCRFTTTSQAALRSR
jgi:hypothetical protein